MTARLLLIGNVEASQRKDVDDLIADGDDGASNAKAGPWYCFHHKDAAFMFIQPAHVDRNAVEFFRGDGDTKHVKRTIADAEHDGTMNGALQIVVFLDVGWLVSFVGLQFQCTYQMFHQKRLCPGRQREVLVWIQWVQIG